MAGQGRGLPTRRRRRSRIFYCLLPARAPSFLQRVRRPASRPSPGEAARARSEPSRRERAETEKTRRGGRRRTTITKRTTPKHKKKSLRFSLLCTAAAAAGPPPPPGNHTSPLNYYAGRVAQWLHSMSHLVRWVGHPLPLVRRLDFGQR